MNAVDRALKFEDKCLLMQIIQLYDNNNEIKISASNKNKLSALSLAWLTE